MVTHQVVENTKTNEPTVSVDYEQITPYIHDISTILVAICACMFGVALRKGLKVVKSLEKKIESSYESPDKYFLDYNQEFKIRVKIVLEQILANLKCDSVTLGIMHNGKFSESGWSFSRVTFEIEALSKNMGSNLTRVNSQTVSQWLDDSRQWYRVQNYWARNLYFGNTIVGVLLVNKFSEGNTDNLESTLNEVENDVNNLTELMKSNIKTP